MFTGLIEEIGVVSGSEETARGLRIDIAAGHVLNDLGIGDSIAVDGVCQTVVARSGSSFAVEAMTPTLERTTLGAMRPGIRVNLERAVALGTRLGGHLVQGHVDAVGRVTAVEPVAEHVLLSVEVAAELADLMIPHGSIAINGVSLTIHRLHEENVVQVALIPHTRQHTNLADLRAGAAVNIEGDMVGKFVVEYLKRRGAHAV